MHSLEYIKAVNAAQPSPFKAPRRKISTTLRFALGVAAISLRDIRDHGLEERQLKNLTGDIEVIEKALKS